MPEDGGAKLRKLLQVHASNGIGSIRSLRLKELFRSATEPRNRRNSRMRIRMLNLNDYRSSRAANKFGFGFLLLSGVIILAIAVVMYLLYRSYL